MLFGSIFFATTALSVKSMTLGDTRAFQAANNPRSLPLDVRSFTSVYTLLHHWSVFGLILLYAYICEYHPPFPHGPKSYDRDEFFFLTGLLFLASIFTLKKNKSARIMADAAVTKNGGTLNNNNNNSNNNNNNSNNNKAVVDAQNHSTEGVVQPVDEATDVLNRDQTEEWKGWMQFMFLLYHYYHAEEVYNSIRVMITCYVWMTGFGNFSFFYLKGDYGSVRVMQMLWRLNFLVIFLVLTQGTTYILYYICLLHTYFFLMVYVTMRVAKGLNYSKWGIRIKLAVVAILLYVIWDLDSGRIFRGLHWLFLSEVPMLGATSGAMWEWYFRSSLDHYSTYLGMVFALNYPITSLFFRKLEAQPPLRHYIAKALVGIAFAAATIWWVLGPFRHAKLEYNATNAYFACIPLLSYIYFRNLTPWLRSNTLDLLHQIGKTTLETYLMQHHIWLTSDAKSLLVLIPGYPKINFLVVSVLYVIMSRRLYQLTLFLRGMVLPNNRDACIRNLAGMAGIIGFFIGLAAVLREIGLVNMFTIGICCLTCGMTLYGIIVKNTWQNFVDTAETKSLGPRSVLSMLESLLVPLAGSLVLLAMGFGIYHMVQTGATKILPLPETCSAYVQKGSWVSIDACSEEARGLAYRDLGINNFGTCSPQSNIHAWGWEAPPSNSQCRFVQRDSKSLGQILNQRNVTYVGDSVVRHLYHATCRQMGDHAAGAYNTSMGKWADFSRRYKNTALEFRWAPYADSMLAMVTNISQSTPKSDLIVIGGGAWDRLHKYNNESEQQALSFVVKTLAAELKTLRDSGISVVWVTPTTINTWGLLTDEKRMNIREDQIAELRAVFASQGIRMPHLL